MTVSPDRTSVVTVFLQRDDRVLLARRSQEVRTYRGRWAGISGYLETEDPEEQARLEVHQETGLEEEHLRPAARGEPLPVDDPENDRFWTVYPFRFAVDSDAPTVQLDREHREGRWVTPEDIRGLATVPGLWDAWCRVRP